MKRKNKNISNENIDVENSLGDDELEKVSGGQGLSDYVKTSRTVSENTPEEDSKKGFSLFGLFNFFDK